MMTPGLEPAPRSRQVTPAVPALQLQRTRLGTERFRVPASQSQQFFVSALFHDTFLGPHRVCGD
jgi:hypothetical protein